MTRLEDQLDQLENTYYTYILPEIIDYDAYVGVVVFLKQYSNSDVYIHCNGYGGESIHGISIVSAIKEHGRVTGVLSSGACSCHSIIYMACKQRIATEFAYLYIHQPSTGRLLDDLANAKECASTKEHLDYLIDIVAKIYVKGSKKSYKFWKDALDNTSKNVLRLIKYDEMVTYGIIKENK